MTTASELPFNSRLRRRKRRRMLPWRSGYRKSYIKAVQLDQEHRTMSEPPLHERQRLLLPQTLPGTGLSMTKQLKDSWSNCVVEDTLRVSSATVVTVHFMRVHLFRREKPF
jgi:hypothetical protein